MQFLDQAYQTIKDHSMVILDSNHKKQIKENYLKAKPIAESGDSVKAIATLIEGVRVNALNCFLSDGRVVSPLGVFEYENAYPISLDFTINGTVNIRLPHFDLNRSGEWKTLFNMSPLIFSNKSIVVDLRGNKGRNGRSMIIFLDWLFGSDWIYYLHHKKHHRAVYQCRVSTKNMLLLEQQEPKNKHIERQRNELLHMMYVSKSEFVSTKLPDYDLPEVLTPRKSYQGEVKLIVNETVAGAVINMVQLLKNESGIKIEGEFNDTCESYLEPYKVTFPFGDFTVPIKRTVYSS